MPFSNDELTETSDRTVRLWNELYQKLYPDRPELATARIYGEGALLPFIDYVRNANQAEILEMQWAVFATNRVYLDAISPGNIVIGSGGETFILDPGNVIKFSGPEDLEKSQVSLDVIPCLLGRYGWFLVQYSKDPRYDKVSIFTQALIALGALNLLLKPGVNLVDRDFQGNLLHWNLIAELSKLFLSLIKKVSLPQSDLFAPEASDNLAERNAIIENFADLYNLTGEEINVLRLTPSVSLYEEPMKNLSYFRTNFRFDILQTYSLVSERFFHVAAFLLLKPLSFRIKNIRIKLLLIDILLP